MLDMLILTNTPLDAQKVISDKLSHLQQVIWVRDLLSVVIKAILKNKIPLFRGGDRRVLSLD